MSDSGEGRWTLQAAVDEGVPADVLAAALFSRFASQGQADFAQRVLSAMRKEFGGHDEKPAAGEGDGVTLKPAEPQAIVVFGASGDLTKRKLLPAFFHLYAEGLLPHGFALVGYARTPMTDAQFRDYARSAVAQYSKAEPSGEVWEDFTDHLSYVAGEFDSERSMDHLRTHLEEIDRTNHTDGGRFYYCATPPAAYPSIVKRLGESELHTGAKIVVEKPFGHDLESARALNAEMHAVFDESQIFRIDHYLGKETVQNILAFRFANGMFEPIWNRRYVDNVQITVAEEIGIEGRGQFYEQTGTIRDMVATHLFQVLTFLAMEPPVSFDPDRLRDEKVKVLRAMKVCDPRDAVRGQYNGLPRRARREARLAGRDLRRARARDRQLALGRRARSSCAPART